VARADVIKAQLQLQQRERDLLDAQTAVLKARIALGVMLFPDPMQPYAITDDITPDLPLAPLVELNPLAKATSPDIRAAEASLRQSDAAIRVAQGAYYPSLVSDYFYGINSNVLDVRGPEDRKNLGSAVQGSITIPVWNWGATRSKVRQAQLQKQQAVNDLTFVQRELQSALATLYIEVQTAKSQLESLRGSLDLAAESLRLTLLRYEAGEATALEVADAQTTLVQARNARDDGLARYRIAVAGLQTLTGRL
jgi:outer membrane protein TolC